MSAIVDVLLPWLQSKYRSLGLTINVLPNSEVAVKWIPVSETAADLLDPDIGVWVRFSEISNADNASSQVQRDLRWALEMASRLEVRSGIEHSKRDKYGQWQVHINWIIGESTKVAFGSALRAVRSRSAHAEEIGIDVIEVSNGDIGTALTKDGVPCLLFQTRQLLRLDANQMPEWLSPDAEYEAALNEALDSVGDRELKKFSADFMSRFTSAPMSAPVVGAPANLTTLHVRNFRNVVSADISLSTDGSAIVVHGPNGSGKSSLFEAICLSMFGSSERYCDYLQDKDVPVKVGYLDHVLRRFSASATESPSIRLGSVEVIDSLASSLEAAKESLSLARGTVLAQESARDFLQMSAPELASVVLGDYSPRARLIQQEVDAGCAVARNDWQDWLRSMGLNASITKPETIVKKICSKVLADSFPPEPTGSIQWLEEYSLLFPEIAPSVRDAKRKWDAIDSVQAREALVDQVAAAVSKAGDAVRPIRNWLIDRAEASSQVSMLIAQADSSLLDLRSNWQSILEDIGLWEEWLSASRPEVEVPAAVPAESLQLEISIRNRLSTLAPTGKLLKGRKDHLHSLQPDFLSLWEQSYPHNCPSCDSRHDGSIGGVISAIESRVDEMYFQIRQEYSELQEQLKQLQRAATSAGAPPLSQQRVVELERSFGQFAAAGQTLEESLSSKELTTALFASRIERLLAVPRWRESESEEVCKQQATEAAGIVLGRRAVGVQKQELPELWGELKKIIDQTALSTVSSHLPRRIGSVWSEICLALAPSHWYQIRQPRMSMELKRGAERLSVVVQRSVDASELPARHILNQAEQHVLGLAWFFTRHLSHGRFIAPLVALDDPAQEMDQVTYRKFVRFLQSFQRMHNRLYIPFGMIIFLHQEDRALDLARAVSPLGKVTMLEWAQEVRAFGEDATVRMLQLRNAEQLAPLPPPFSATDATTQDAMA